MCTTDFPRIIKIEFKTTSYVMEQSQSVLYRTHLINKAGIYTDSDQIGCFKERVGGFDAVCFMSLRQRIRSVLTVHGVSVDVGPNFYRQLFAEVNTLLKLKRSTGKKVVMHANANFGFVKPLPADKRLGTPQIQWVLHSSNAKIFVKDTTDQRRLMYLYHKCVLRTLLLPDANKTTVFCNTVDNMNRLLEHKLLHFSGVGGTCNYCGIRGELSEMLIKKLSMRLDNLSLSEIVNESRNIDEERCSSEVR